MFVGEWQIEPRVPVVVCLQSTCVYNLFTFGERLQKLLSAVNNSKEDNWKCVHIIMDLENQEKLLCT